jgi:hypothetical protein
LIIRKKVWKYPYKGFTINIKVNGLFKLDWRRVNVDNEKKIIKEFNHQPYNRQYLISFLESLGYKDIELDLTDDLQFVRVYMKENEEDKTLFIKCNSVDVIQHMSFFKGKVEEYKSTSLGYGILLLVIVILGIVGWFLFSKI